MEIKDYAFARDVLEAAKFEKAIRDRRFYERQRDYFDIEKVIFNPPATIVIWIDGTKTVVKCNGEKFDQEKGLAMAISKRALAVGNRYHKTFKKWCKEEDDFSDQIKKDPRFKNIKVSANFRAKEISEDNPLKVGEEVVVLATGEELAEINVPEIYSLHIGKITDIPKNEDYLGVEFGNGDFWFITDKLLRRVVDNAKTK